MSFQSIVYGRIISGNSIAENMTIINNLENEQAFPWITREMFSMPELESPYYFENLIITFGATYKQVEDDLTCWLIKFENILSKLDFVTAKIEVETGIYGTYHFFWKSKSYNYGQHSDEYYNEMGLNIGENWYYGYGQRSLWGTLEDTETESQLKSLHNVRHPYIITPEDEILLDKLLKHIDSENTIYFYDLPKEFINEQERIFPLLTKLAVENIIEFKATNSYRKNEFEKFGPYIKLCKK